MRRILLVVMVALMLVAAMAVAAAAPAFADPPAKLCIKKEQLGEGYNVPKPCGPFAG